MDFSFFVRIIVLTVVLLVPQISSFRFSSTLLSSPSPTSASCKATVDLAFIVDSSGSIGRRNWPRMLNFLKSLINEFNVGPNGTHVAVVSYSTRPVREFTFNTTSDAKEYGKRIDRMPFQRGYTYIDKALMMANESVFVLSAGMRPDVPKIAIVLTDGVQTKSGRYTPLNVASQGIKDKCVLVYSIGIGRRVSSQELWQISSSDDKALFVSGFDKLLAGVKLIAEKSCSSASAAEAICKNARSTEN